MTRNWTKAPQSGGELNAFVEDFLVIFNARRRTNGQPEVGAYVSTLEDCGVWACVLEERRVGTVFVLPLYSVQEIEQTQNQHGAESQARGELVARFRRNTKDIGSNPSPEKLAEEIWNLTVTSSRKEGAVMPDPRSVFVIHGRNLAARNAMFDFLRAIGLNPIEWSEAITMTRKGSPYIGEVLDTAFANAQAVVAVLTGDDEAHLREVFQDEDDPDYEKNLTPQARPNVLFEAGMAFGRHPERTIMVQIGHLRPFSDVAGRHSLRFDGTAENRTELRQRLITSECQVKEGGTDWLKAGDFDKALRLATPAGKPTGRKK